MELAWITLHVQDLEAAREFYEGYLGLSVQRAFSPHPGTDICFLACDNGPQVELICDEAQADGESQGSGCASVGLRTERYDELLVRARERGILVGEPQTMPGGMQCFFACDPDGTRLQIIRG